MREWIRSLTLPSFPVPIARDRIRQLELAFAALILVVPIVLSLVTVDPGGLLDTIGQFTVVVAPTLLAIVVLLGALDDGLRVDSFVMAIISVMTLYLAVVSLYLIYDPPAGGGVFFGHLLTFAAGLVLAVAVVGRELLWYLLGRLRAGN